MKTSQIVDLLVSKDLTSPFSIVIFLADNENDIDDGASDLLTIIHSSVKTIYCVYTDAKAESRIYEDLTSALWHLRDSYEFFTLDNLSPSQAFDTLASTLGAAENSYELHMDRLTLGLIMNRISIPKMEIPS
jgi:hypothetical protein